MVMHPLPRPSPPRRHLALTGVCVVGLHLTLLGSPLTAVGSWDRVDMPTRSTSSPPGPDYPGSRGKTAAPSPAVAGPGTLSVRWVQQTPVSLPHSPDVSPEATEPDLPVIQEPEPNRWTLAQTSTEGESSLRLGPSEKQTLLPVKLPNSGRLQFDVLGKIKGFGYTVSGELVWQQDGRQYQSRFEIGMPILGSRVQTSQGQIDAGGLLPTRFGDKVRSEQAAHFERDKGLISFSANTPSVALEPGAQDRLSLFMQLASLLAGAPQRYPNGTLITLQIVSAREAEPWTFRVDAAETLQLPVGPTPAVRLTRLPRQPYDQQVDLWFAPSMGYLPVRLRVTHPNGDVADQVLRRLVPPG